MWKVLGLLVFVCSLVACASVPQQGSDGSLPKLLPVRDFTANKHSLWGYRISPDGTRLAWGGVSGTDSALYVRDLGSGEERVYPYRPVAFHWAGDSRHLLLLQDRKGDELTHLFRLDVTAEDSWPEDLTPIPGRRVILRGLPPDRPERVLVMHNGRDAALFDLYAIDINTGQSTLLGENPGDVVDWLGDRSGELLGRIRQTDSQRVLELREGAGYRELARWDLLDRVGMLGFTPDQRSLWMLSNHGRERVGLYTLGLADGQWQLVHEDPAVDLNGVALGWQSGRLMAAYSMPDYPRVHWFDAQLEAHLGSLIKDDVRSVQITGVDRADRRLVIATKSHAGTRYLMYDRGTGSIQVLGQSDSLGLDTQLGAPQPIRFKARDGLEIPGYLTRPAGSGNAALPTVLLVHGGPWYRDDWFYSRRVQFLVNRGYQVLQINYRGSTGYGRAFLDAGKGEIGRAMQTDLLDGVQWLLDRGLAEPQRVAIMGYSYGGYAALMGMTSSPGVFQCAIDANGPTDIAALLDEAPPEAGLYLKRWHEFVGDPDQPQQRADMQGRSPLYRADQVQGPILIVQGEHDSRVQKAQAERMVAALQQAGKPVTYLSFAKAGHKLDHWTVRLRAFRAYEDFLAECIGGRRAGFDYYQLATWLF